MLPFVNVVYFLRLLCLFCLPETALKLDTLVGDIEDAVSYTMNKSMRKQSASQNSQVSMLS